MQKVLMVQDDPLFLPAMLDLLEAENANVITTNNGVVGLQMIEELKPDLVVVVVHSDAKRHRNRRRSDRFSRKLHAV